MGVSIVGKALVVTGLMMLTGCISASLSAPERPTPDAMAASDYARAERFLPRNAKKYLTNGDVQVHWIGTTDRFWYLRDTAKGTKFVLVDAATGEKTPAFDHLKLASGLSAVIGQKADPEKLPFTSFQFLGADGEIQFVAAKKTWICQPAKAQCRQAERSNKKPGDLVSPDGKHAVFIRDHNIWLRSLVDGTETALTTDGQEHFSYAKLAGSSTTTVSVRRAGAPLPPVALWSADSTKLLTQQLDERQVKDLTLLQYVPETGGPRPVLHRYRYAMPGDAHSPAATLVMIDLTSGNTIRMQGPPMPVAFVGPIADSRAWWSKDAKRVYVLPREEGQKILRLLAVDAATGKATSLIEEHGKTYLDAGADGTGLPNVHVLTSGEVIWWSERDGWGHLYLYDRSGTLVRQLTTGNWQVRSIVRLDEQGRKIYFTAGGREAGRDPYLRHLYAINLDGSDLQLLTPEHADHDIRLAAKGIEALLSPDAPSAAETSFSPSGRYFVQGYSRPDLPPVTVLRATSGEIISRLEQADISALEAGGFVLPQPFQVTASDGETVLYGTLFRPSHFDPARSYPVLDSIYPGPQIIRTRKSFKSALFDRMEAQSLAELGFIVVTLDGRGTPFRSKAFHDVSYGDLGQAGNLEDHIAGLKQLAGRYAFIDLNRVGIFGHSGGGYASTRAILSYPDFFKVAVSSAGNHDQSGYLRVWGPTYQGPFAEDGFDAINNAKLAAQLQGKLLLVHGDMDDNVHPALTLQMVDALIKANKEFDFLLLPNANHNLMSKDGYFIRKRWGYFVRHLLEKQPPENIIFTDPDQ